MTCNFKTLTLGSPKGPQHSCEEMQTLSATLRTENENREVIEKERAQQYENLKATAKTD